jgi:hypothetical protein
MTIAFAVFSISLSAIALISSVCLAPKVKKDLKEHWGEELAVVNFFSSVHAAASRPIIAAESLSSGIVVATTKSIKGLKDAVIAFCVLVLGYLTWIYLVWPVLKFLGRQLSH